MKKYLLVVVFFFLGHAVYADGLSAFKAGLEAFRTNRAEALVSSWYDPTAKEQMNGVRKRFGEVTAGLGDVADVEVFEPKNLGRRVQHLYGVIYFRNAPVWVRAVYYTLDDRSGFLSIECSRRSDEILPVTPP